MRNKATSSGTFEGRGVVDLSGTITNNGRVIANGYGVDSTLDLSSFSGIANTVDNIDANGSTDNGWFVEDHGKLVLPAFTIASGDSTRYWGEDGDLDLVNAVKMDFHGVTGGDLSISLIDRDHAEMPTFDVTGSPGTPAVLLGGWYFDTSGGFDFGTGTVDLTFRYDDALADLLVGFTEGDTKLYHYTGGAWVEESFTLYTENNYLEVTGVNSFSFRSLGNDKIEQQFGAVPEPGTVVFLLAGIGLAVRKRLTK